MVRTSFILELSAITGTDLKTCLSDALALSKALRVWVQFEFNGETLNVKPTDNAENLYSQYHNGEKDFFEKLLAELKKSGNLKQRVGRDLNFEQLGKLCACVSIFGNAHARLNLEDYIKYSWKGKIFEE